MKLLDSAKSGVFWKSNVLTRQTWFTYTQVSENPDCASKFKMWREDF